MGAVLDTEDLPVGFSSNSISLDLPPSGVTTEGDAWTIAPMSHPEVRTCYPVNSMYCPICPVSDPKCKNDVHVDIEPKCMCVANIAMRPRQHIYIMHIPGKFGSLAVRADYRQILIHQSFRSS